MAATFSVAQTWGAGAGTVTNLGATGSLWYFKQGTTSGTHNYNAAGTKVPAGENSYGIQLRPYFSTTGTNSFSNIRFYRSGGAWDAANFTALGTSTNGYTQSTNSSTVIASGGASNVAVPTSSTTDNAIMLGSVAATNGTTYGPTYLRVQLTTNSNAPAGDTAAETFTWVYDES